MTDIAPAPLPRTHRRKCRYRVGVMAGRFAIIERMSGDVVEAGFDSYERAWERIMVLLDGSMMSIVMMTSWSSTLPGYCTA